MTTGERTTGGGGRAFVTVLVTLTLVTAAATACAGGSAGGVATTVNRAEPSSGCRLSSPAGAVGGGPEQTRTLVAGTSTGSYELSVPRTYRSRHPTALILLFYGFASDPAQFSALTGMASRGSADGYLVAVPHTQPGEAEWQLNGHGTDADFVDAVVASLEATYCVDRRAVFAVGFSAGAAFTIVYSCARPDSFAAIATVAVEFQLGCTRPLSIEAFHGTGDPLVPYANGAVGLSLPGVKVRGTQLNMGDWARLDHCRSGPRRTRIGSQVVRQQWNGCAPGTQVVLYTVIGGGHSWPGADPAKAVGLTTQQIDATSEVLTFFGHHRN